MGWVELLIILCTLSALVGIYYSFLKASLDTFTYKKPRRVYLALVSILAVLISLKVSYVLGFATLVSFLAVERLNSRELMLVAFSTQFGFMMGMAVVMIILISLGFIFDIPALKVEMTFEDIMRFLSQQ
ncbi:hypothetical protein PAP_09285 [Palaeococcus pacificus DY20341]|uniref:Uncharacterized protein n=1 Tax=Palaeococcus pacificus DY20341 TaxID=1343739 RepID=A0A075LU42_9EURY|nr:hypothetical protein [Palaeococcus pacificus]AIF70235.1 hypothetical protein PAP_09285 [Palaeococcus pacificus DY20341]